MDPRFVRFCLVGTANACGHLAVAWLLVELQHWRPLAANAVAFLAANLFSFVANSRLTFGVAARWSRYSSFLAISLTSLAISSLAVWLGQRLGVHYLLAIGAGALLSAGFGFLLSQRIVYQASKGR